jgi:hypothetical protein
MLEIACGTGWFAIPGKSQLSLTVFSINRNCSIPAQTVYPAARQTGQGWSSASKAAYGHPVVEQDGIGAVIEGVYIWDNSGSGTSDPNYVGLNQDVPDKVGKGQKIEKYLVQNRTFLLV